MDSGLLCAGVSAIGRVEYKVLLGGFYRPCPARVGTREPASLQPVFSSILILVLVRGDQKSREMAPIPSALAIPSHGDEIIVSLLAPHVLLLTLNRPKVLNAVSQRMTDGIDRILNWAEQEGEIWWAKFYFFS